MKDVIVYRCGKVVADGVELSHVRAVDPPLTDTIGPLMGSISLDITGTLTYSPLTYAKAPAAAVAKQLPSINSDQVERFYQAGKIDYRSYSALMKAMNVPPCVPPPPPEPEHPDTTRVRKVIVRIENLWKAGKLTTARRFELLNALA